jgi:hypothetical protein
MQLTDMNGHAHRPNSKQYFENIASVDSGVAQLELVLAKLFNDSATAFVLTCATLYVSSKCYICVLILLYVSSYYYMCPHTYVSSCYYM